MILQKYLEIERNQLHKLRKRLSFLLLTEKTAEFTAFLVIILPCEFNKQVQKHYIYL